MGEINISQAEAVNTGSAYFTTLQAGHHKAFADEPTEFGGMDKAPSPADYLCMSLAGCKTITLRMYAARKNWPLAEVRVQVKLVKGTGANVGKNTFFCETHLDGDLDISQKERLMEISKSCPVQRLLSTPNEVISILM